MIWRLRAVRFLKRPLLTVSRSFMNVTNSVLWRMATILKANEVNLFVCSVLFVFWYHSLNFLDPPRIQHSVLSAIGFGTHCLRIWGHTCTMKEVQSLKKKITQSFINRRLLTQKIYSWHLQARMAPALTISVPVEHSTAPELVSKRIQWNTWLFLNIWGSHSTAIDDSILLECDA
jgi:hypothetical protein